MLYHSYYRALSYTQNAAWIQIMQAAVCINEIKVYAVIIIHNTKEMKKWTKCSTYHK